MTRHGIEPRQLANTLPIRQCPGFVIGEKEDNNTGFKEEKEEKKREKERFWLVLRHVNPCLCYFIPRSFYQLSFPNNTKMYRHNHFQRVNTSNLDKISMF